MATLTEIRQGISKRLGSYIASTASAGTGTGALMDTKYPVYSSSAQDELYQDWFLFLPGSASTDKCRRVATYTPGNGQLTPDSPWGNAPAVGAAYELHAIMDPLNEIHPAINESLRRLLVVTETTLTISDSDDNRQSLAALTWLLNPNYVRQVGWLDSTEDRTETDPYGRVVRGMVQFYDGVPYLEHPSNRFDTTQTLYLKILKPAYYHCKASGGAFGSQTGLSAETDEAPVAADWAISAGLLECLNSYVNLADQGDNQKVMRMRNEEAARFNTLTTRYFHKPISTLRPGVSAWGPNASSSGSGLEVWH
jgi:hypothetical protein